MKSLLKKCAVCGIYTLRERCPKCGGPTGTAHPPKFSPEDKYLRLRLRVTYDKWLKEAGETEG